MDKLIRHFVREAPGVWRCQTDATVTLASGRIQVASGTRVTRGTFFMGIELARLLDEQYEKQKAT